MCARARAIQNPDEVHVLDFLEHGVSIL